MNVISGIRDMIQISLFRAKSIRINMDFINDYLQDRAETDEQTERLLADIRTQSDALTQSFKALMQNINSQETTRTMHSVNRRNEERLIVEGEATIVTREWIQPCILKNLSRGGIAIMGRFPFNERRQVDIVVSSPFFSNTVYKNARIAWYNKIHHELWEGGIEFKSSKGLIN